MTTNTPRTQRNRNSVGILFSLLLVCLTAGAATDKNSNKGDYVGWDAVPKILARIVPPTFPDRDFDITKYGAVADNTTDIKPALDKAIAACNAAGGGRVVVPAGDWFIKGPIHLKSHVNLHLAEGATINFSTDPSDYEPAVFTCKRRLKSAAGVMCVTRRFKSAASSLTMKHVSQYERLD